MDEVSRSRELYLAKIERQMERQGKSLRFTEPRSSLVRERLQPGIRCAFPETNIDEHVKLPITNLWKAFTGFTVDLIDGKIDVTGN